MNVTRDGVPYVRVLPEGLEAFRAFPPQTQTRPASRPDRSNGFRSRFASLTGDRGNGWGGRMAPRAAY